MFCKKCGNNLSEDARFCGRCGEPTKVKAEEATFSGKAQKQKSQASEGFEYHRDINNEYFRNENTGEKGTEPKKKRPVKQGRRLVPYVLIMLILVASLGVYLGFGESLIPRIKAVFTDGESSQAPKETDKEKEDKQKEDNQNSKDEAPPKTNSSQKDKSAEEKEAQYKLMLSLIEQEAERTFRGIKGNYSLAFRDLSRDSYLSINNSSKVAASVITIYVMIEAFRQVEYGGLSLYRELVLTDNVKVGGTGVIRNERAGTVFTLEELIYLMIAKSDNTATNMLIGFLGMNNINNTIASLGCTHTSLNRYMMDQAAINRGIENYTSVEDLCMILSKIYMGQCISKSADEQMLYMLKRNETDTKITAQLPLTVEVANKTGELTGVENDCGIIFTSKGAYVLCVLTADGTVGEQRSCISYLSKYVYDKYMSY